MLHIRSRLRRGILGVASIAVIVALGFTVAFVPIDAEATHQPVPFMGIDADPTGNSPNSVGVTNNCAHIDAIGGTLQVDVVIKGVPEGDEHSLGGASFDLAYDPSLLKVTAFDGAEMLPGAFTAFSDSVPDSDGFFRAETGLIGPPAYPFGDGVVARFTLQAVGSGSTNIYLTDMIMGDNLPKPLAATGAYYDLSALGSAQIIVGTGSCGDPTPLPTPTPTLRPPATPGPTLRPDETPSPTPTRIPSAVDIPISLVAVDTNVASNTPDSIGGVDSCAHLAGMGSRIDVDVVIDGIDGQAGHILSTVDLGLYYDPTIVKVVAFDGTILMADGFDGLSNAVPDEDGHFWVTIGWFRGAPYPAGDGVLARFTLEAVGMGSTALRLGHLPNWPFSPPVISDPNGFPYYVISELRHGQIAVGNVNCGDPTATPAFGGGDGDGDGVIDYWDNCPNHYNPRQEDLDQDRKGAACDPDEGGEGANEPNCTEIPFEVPGVGSASPTTIPILGCFTTRPNPGTGGGVRPSGGNPAAVPVPQSAALGVSSDAPESTDNLGPAALPSAGGDRTDRFGTAGWLTLGAMAAAMVTIAASWIARGTIPRQ